MTIFEIGSCEGEDTIKLRRKYPNAKIFAFEPLPKNVSKMRKNYKKYGASRISINQIALSDKDGGSVFHVSSGHPKELPKQKGWDYGNKSSSLLPPKQHLETHKWLQFKDKIEVKTERLDTFCAKHKIEKIDFMYLDVQGAELMVLKGAGKLLKNISAVWLEVEAIELYSKQPLKKDVESFMAAKGFICIKDTVGSVSGDQLYIKSDFPKIQPAVIKPKRSYREFTKRLKLPNHIMRKRKAVELGDDLEMIIPEDMIWAFTNGAYYEKNVAYWLEKISTHMKHPVFYDIGANYGYYSLKLSAACHQIYAFEPVGFTYSILKSNIKVNHIKNVSAYKTAIGSSKTRAEINIYSSSGNNSIFNRIVPEDHPLKYVRKEAIEIRTLDDFVKQHNIAAPNLIKIDVEGSELDVFKGSKIIIKKHMPIILVEYSENTSKDAGYSRLEILKTLTKANYKVYGLSSNPEDIKLYSTTSTMVEIDNLIAVPKTFDIKGI